jgi:hypothetical protein
MDSGQRAQRRMVGDRHPPGTRQGALRRPRLEAARDRHRQHRRVERHRQPERADLELPEAPIEAAAALREDHHGGSLLQQAAGLAHRGRIPRIDVDGERAQDPDELAEQRHGKELVPGHVVDAPADGNGHERRIRVGLVIGRDDEAAVPRDVLGPAQLEAEPGAGETVHDRAKEVQDRGTAHGA